VSDRSFGEDTDIQRVAIAHKILETSFASSISRDLLCAVSLRHKPVEGRNHVGKLLRAIDTEVTGLFVQLVLDGISRDDFDKDIHKGRAILPQGNAVPGVRFEVLFEVAK
jgi:hypothetical protein